MKQPIFKYLYFIIIMFVTSGCFKEDLSKIAKTSNWTTTMSIPISNINVEASDFKGGSFLNWFKTNSNVPFSLNSKFNYATIFKKVDKVKKIKFRVNVTNNFPAKIRINIYTVQEGINKMIKLNEESIVVNEAVLNDDGTIKSSSMNMTDIYLEEEEIQKIVKTKYLNFRVVITDFKITPETLQNIDNYKVLTTVGLSAYIEDNIKVF